MKRIRIDISEYLEAPIDDKNVMSDSIIENLFDEGNYVWDRNEAMGFVGGVPTFATYHDNKMELCVPHMPGGINLVKYVNGWGKSVIERITGESCEEEVSWEDHRLMTFLIGDGPSEERLIVSFLFNADMRVYFLWNQKK